MRHRDLLCIALAVGVITLGCVWPGHTTARATPTTALDATPEATADAPDPAASRHAKQGLSRRRSLSTEDPAMPPDQEVPSPDATKSARATRVRIIAHRGNSSEAPENTIASCLAAANLADMTEMDTRTTADGKLVLFHDNELDRLAGKAGRIEDLTRAQVDRLEVGSWFAPEFAGEPIPTLREALLAAHPDLIPVIERKSGTPEQHAEVIRQLGLDLHVVIAFDWDWLEEFERLIPEIPTGALGSKEFTPDKLQQIRDKGIDFVNWAHADITAETVRMVHDAGLPMYVWTVNEEARMRELIDWGVDGITTDRPRLLRSLLEE